jgi:hypothetical protein
MVIIDAYTHFACPEFVAHLESKSGHAMVFRGLFSRIPELTDVSARLKLMDELGVQAHCVVPLPWLECEPAIHANEQDAAEVRESGSNLIITLYALSCKQHAL